MFKIGGGEMTAKELDVPFLGRLPFDPGFVRGGDDGVHRIVSEPEGGEFQSLRFIVDALSERLESGSEDEGLTII